MAEKKNVVVEEVPKKKSSGTSLYIGPSIKGILQTRTIIPCHVEDIESRPEIAIALKQRPAIKGLIIDGADFFKAKEELEDHGSDLYKLYKEVSRGDDINKEDK